MLIIELIIGSRSGYTDRVRARILCVGETEVGVSRTHDCSSVIDLMLETVVSRCAQSIADFEDGEELQGVAVGIEVGVNRISPPVCQSLER